MAAATLLACDWGTTNLRGWTLDAAGAVVKHVEMAIGVSALAPGEAAQRFERDVRPALDAAGLPAILCGMVGSNLGWALAPYADCPAGFAELARSALQVAPQVRIVPGLRCTGLTGAPDVMRGEETQILGWLAQHPERQRGRHLVCHPGTHAKWVVVEEGRIMRFVTAMTGELFSVLSKHSILRHDAPATDVAAFAAGVISFLSPCVLPLVPGYVAVIKKRLSPAVTTPKGAEGPSPTGVVERDKQVEIMARLVLMKFDPKEVTDENLGGISRYVKDKETGPKLQALNVLGLIGQPAAKRIDDMVFALADDDPTVVVAGLTAIIQLGPACKAAIPNVERLRTRGMGKDEKEYWTKLVDQATKLMRESDKAAEKKP